MTTLQECLTGKSSYDHAGKVKELYEKLDALGNNKEWQLYVLSILTDGIAAKLKAENDLRACLKA